MNSLARMLFEEIVDVLKHRWIALSNCFDALTKPSNGRTKRGTISSDLPLAAQLVQRCPKGIIVRLLHPNVVKLKQVNAICCQSLQGGIRRPANRLRAKILRNFTLPAPFISVVDEVVT